MSWIGVRGAVFLMLVVSACAGTPESAEYVFGQIPAEELRFRRPSAPAASDRAGPGGVDYQSRPGPDVRWDCRTAAQMITEANVSVVRSRECVAGLGEGVTLRYRLQRNHPPRWILVSQKGVPECVRETLGVIPVPREVYFVAPLDGRASCFVSALDTERGRVLDARLPVGRAELVVRFPLQEAPKSDSDWIRTLAGWSLTAIWSVDHDRRLNATVFPDHLCKECFGEATLKDLMENPPTWP